MIYFLYKGNKSSVVETDFISGDHIETGIFQLFSLLVDGTICYLLILCKCVTKYKQFN